MINGVHSYSAMLSSLEQLGRQCIQNHSGSTSSSSADGERPSATASMDALLPSDIMAHARRLARTLVPLTSGSGAATASAAASAPAASSSASASASVSLTMSGSDSLRQAMNNEPASVSRESRPSPMGQMASAVLAELIHSAEGDSETASPELPHLVYQLVLQPKPPCQSAPSLDALSEMSHSMINESTVRISIPTNPDNKSSSPEAVLGNVTLRGSHRSSISTSALRLPGIVDSDVEENIGDVLPSISPVALPVRPVHSHSFMPPPLAPRPVQLEVESISSSPVSTTSSMAPVSHPTSLEIDSDDVASVMLVSERAGLSPLLESSTLQSNQLNITVFVP